MDQEESELSPFNSSYRLHRELFGHQSGVRCACNVSEEQISRLIDQGLCDPCLVKDIEYLVTGGVAGEVFVWKFDGDGSCDLLSQFLAHTNTVMCICPSKLLNPLMDTELSEGLDETGLIKIERSLCVYTCGRDNIIHRVNLTGEKLLTLEGHSDAVCSLHEMDDGLRLVSGGWDGIAIVWDIMSGTQEYRISCEGCQYSVYVNSLPNGLIVTVMQNGDLCLWSGRDLVDRRHVHNDVIRAVSIGDNNIITTSNDCTVKIHTQSLEPKITIKAHDSFIYDAKHSKLYGVFFTCSEDKSVGVWKLENGQLLQSIALPSSVWQVVETRKNGIAIIPLTGNASMWRLKLGKDAITKQPPIKIGEDTVLYHKGDTNKTTTPVYEMTLYKGINANKVLELLNLYNGACQSKEIELNVRELHSLEQLLKQGFSQASLGGLDVVWVNKLLGWPIEQRLPVFDLLKSLVMYPASEKLFKGKNGGAIIMAACNTITNASDNVQLVTISLKLFSNLLYLSLSRNTMKIHFETISKVCIVAVGNKVRMVQQAYSVLCHNFAVATTSWDNDKAFLIKLVCLIGTGLDNCCQMLFDYDLEKDWIPQVTHRLTDSLKIVLNQHPMISKELRPPVTGIKSILETIMEATSDLRLKDSIRTVVGVLD